MMILQDVRGVSNDQQKAAACNTKSLLEDLHVLLSICSCVDLNFLTSLQVLSHEERVSAGNVGESPGFTHASKEL